MTDDLDTRWYPLSVRECGDYAAYDTLHSGVPDHLDPSLWQWLSQRVQSTSQLEVIERVFGITLSGTSRDFQTLLSSLRYKVATEPEFFLDVVDFFVSRMRIQQFLPGGERTDTAEADMQALVELTVILREARSIWTVAEISPDRYRLQRCVPPAMKAGAEQVMNNGDKAALHLRLAWQAVYGRDLNPSYSYGQAIKAIEVVAVPIVIPNDPQATLGKVISALRDAPAKWAVGLKHPDPARQVVMLADMLDLIWKGQSDRHGDPDPDVPISVEPVQAEAAMHLAVTVVQWFTTGIVARTS